MTLNLLAQPLGEGHGGVQHRTGKNEQKLLSAIAPDAVDLPGLFLQQPRELLQHRIPRLVPVVVVHALELVDVAHHDRQRLVQTH
jgi:hypothetical protein